MELVQGISLKRLPNVGDLTKRLLHRSKLLIWFRVPGLAGFGMSEENNKDRDLMDRFVQVPDSMLEHHIRSTEAMLANTRAFFDRISEAEEDTRRYVLELKQSLENDVRRLEQKGLERERPARVPPVWAERETD